MLDGGSDYGTPEAVERLGLPRVRVVRKENGGKASALNVGIASTTASIVVMVDGDTLFEPDTIRRLVQPLVDDQVGAVSGNTKVGNRRGLLGKWQHIEYVTGLNLDRRMYEVPQCTPTVPGATGAFRRDVLHEGGGVRGGWCPGGTRWPRRGVAAGGGWSGGGPAEAAGRPVRVETRSGSGPGSGSMNKA